MIVTRQNKKRWLRVLHDLERHRKFQLAITSGVCVTSVISVFWPENAHASVIAGLVTNIIWVWE